MCVCESQTQKKNRIKEPTRPQTKQHFKKTDSEKDKRKLSIGLINTLFNTCHMGAVHDHDTIQSINDRKCIKIF